MKYLSIDVETTGLGDDCALIELAMVLEDTELAYVTPVEDLPTFHRIVGHRKAVWESDALAMHLSRLVPTLCLAGACAAVDGVPFVEPSALGETARCWLVSQGIGPLRQITPAGKNFSGFDRRFLPTEITAVLHHRALDPGSVFVDWKKILLPSLRDLGGTVDHCALEDARDVIRVLRRAYA